ncbi:MAG: glycosyltransferase family 2 protein [Candidatus Zophobacter franzmannii]|nr:glycosyltransferase family 2 protein [Candidatus Zophobacter franzmannii]
MTPSPLSCSIGVFAFNEENNIEKILSALLNQQTNKVNIAEIIVVSSACSDNTDTIVERISAEHPIVRLIQETERNGKSASINHFLKETVSDYLVIESADTIPEKDVIEKLVSPFKCGKVGMTGGRPVPENDSKSFVGYAVQLLWRMHHKMAMISPKLGEMVAIKRVFLEIPAESAVDEASIEALIRENGLKTVYIPDAIIYNKGPENISDFVKQRRRIEAGHLWLKSQQHYTVASQSSTLLLKITLTELKERPQEVFKLMGVMILEMYCRLLGKFDYHVKKKNPFIWDIAKSTKNLDRN